MAVRPEPIRFAVIHQIFLKKEVPQNKGGAISTVYCGVEFWESKLKSSTSYTGCLRPYCAIVC